MQRAIEVLEGAKERIGEERDRLYGGNLMMTEHDFTIQEIDEVLDLIGNALVVTESDSKQQKKYEYRREGLVGSLNTLDAGFLNQYGEEGWQLVQVIPNDVYLNSYVFIFVREL